MTQFESVMKAGEQVCSHKIIWIPLLRSLYSVSIGTPHFYGLISAGIILISVEGFLLEESKRKASIFLVLKWKVSEQLKFTAEEKDLKRGRKGVRG